MSPVVPSGNSGGGKEFAPEPAGRSLDGGPEAADWRGGSQLSRGLAALELLARQPATAADIARKIGVNRSTALRMLGELEELGYVQRDPTTKHYSTRAQRFYDLVINHHQHSDWAELVRPVLALMREESGEATVLSVPANGMMVYISYFPSDHVVAVRERLGAVRPMHCSALGQAYLAALSEESLDLELGRLRYEGGSARAVKGPLELRERVNEARQRGYALDLDETFEGASCVAAPVRIQGVVIGSVAISGPSVRLSEERLDTLGRRLVGEVAALEHRL
jgi:DNA-binding IclR family transcriptional regulator